MKRRGVWIAVAAAVVAVVSAGLWAVLQVKEFESLARAGKADAAAALKSLEATDADGAAASFQKAQDEFSRARGILGPDWLHSVPWLGRQLAAADDLAAIGMEGSSAGGAVARLMAGVGGLSGEDRLAQFVKSAQPHLDSALQSLVAVSERTSGLSTEGLVPQLADAVGQVKEAIAPLQPTLDRSRSLLVLERYVFSGDHRLLVVAQNSSELRPTGGFMGTFGVVTLGSSGFRLDSFADIYTLRKDTLSLPLPEGRHIGRQHLYFRDANWWIDFPTSAHTMTTLWQNVQPDNRVDGIVAVDIPMLEALLRVYGPITVPGTSTPVTAANAMKLLNEVVQKDHSGQSDVTNRKLAIVSLVDQLFKRVLQLSPDEAWPTLHALAGAADGKHIQIFFSDATAEAAMVDAGWSGALAPPEGTTDLLAVSNGLVRASKANYGVTKTLDYEVGLSDSGSADTKLTLGYAKNTELVTAPIQWMANYVRVHRLEGTTATTTAGFASLSDATGLPTFGRYFRLDPGRSHREVLSSTVPGALGAADAGGARHYELLLAKQADLVDTDATVTVRVPDGWRVAESSAWFRVSHTPIPTSGSGASVSLHTPLTEDVLLEIALVRS